MQRISYIILVVLCFCSCNMRKAQAAPPCNQSNLLIVLDRSGSMLQTQKWEQVKAGLPSQLKSLENRLRLGLVSFSDQANLDLKLGATVSEMEKFLLTLKPNGATYMEQAMNTAMLHLQQTLTNEAVTRPTFVLLITDGAPSDKCPEQQVKQLRQLKVGNRTHDIKTFVVGFGQQVNPLCLNNLAVQGGTAHSSGSSYWEISNSSDFSTALQHIARSATSTEVCNNLDDDCDGFIDNIKGALTPLHAFCQQGKCPGTRTCQAGKWTPCQPTQAPTSETCNGKDDDCDGAVDNVKDTSNHIARPCQHACGTLKQVCILGKWSPCANYSVREVCDGKDNDCDGRIDENLIQACENCSIKTCQAGVWSSCKPSKPRQEQCNGMDDDCDGFIDNAPNFAQNNTLNQACVPPPGHCQAGIQYCIQGKFTACIAPKPTAEICDGKDNDCNGIIDDPWQSQLKDEQSRSCQTPCGEGRYQCKSDGSGVACVGQGEFKEICDGKDNDCNGVIDDLWPKLGSTCIKKSGSCEAMGIYVCNNTQDDVVCQLSQAPTPAPEICDGKDNDCDGLTDESLVRGCTTNCRAGTQRCLEGAWTTCQPGTDPTPICNTNANTQAPGQNNNTNNTNNTNRNSNANDEPRRPLGYPPHPPPSFPPIRIQILACGCSNTSPSEAPRNIVALVIVLFGFLLMRRR